MDLKPDSSGPDCGCPTDSRIARHFDTKVAERSAKCQDPSLIAVSQRLIDALLSREPAGKTVLELGCGRGALLLELVQAGVARATGVDLSPGRSAPSANGFPVPAIDSTADAGSAAIHSCS
jgi:SAM-dependent methyltransferase